MEAITYTNAQANLANTFTRDCEKAVVVMSLEDYNALEETAYLLR